MPLEDKFDDFGIESIAKSPVHRRLEHWHLTSFTNSFPTSTSLFALQRLQIENESIWNKNGKKKPFTNFFHILFSSQFKANLVKFWKRSNKMLYFLATFLIKTKFCYLNAQKFHYNFQTTPSCEWWINSKTIPNFMTHNGSLTNFFLGEKLHFFYWISQK